MTRPIEPAAPSVPERIEHLAFAEQLVLWAIRHRLCRRNEALVERELDVACGAGAEAREALDRFLDVLGGEARRTLYFHRLCCAGVSRDELALLTLVAACQGGDRAYADGLLLWLLPRAAAQRAAYHVERFANLLTRGGHDLPCRRAARWPELSTERPRAASLH